MNKVKDVLRTGLSALRFSFSFCWRNNRRDTIIGFSFIILLTFLSYFAVVLTGRLVSILQKIISGERHSFVFSEIIKEEFFVPVILVVLVLLAEMVLRKLSWFFQSRWRHTLSIANKREIHEHKASLDIGRLKSKQFDDLEKKIDELPGNWQTRIWLAMEMMGLFKDSVSFLVFGATLFFQSPLYVFVIIGSATPMIFAEFFAVNRFWRLSQDLAPHHKKRYVLERAYNNTVAFLQGIMFRQMPTLRKQIDENTGYAVKQYNNLRLSTLQSGILTHFLAMCGLCFVLLDAVGSTVSIGGDIGALTVLIASARRLQGDIVSVVRQIAENWNNAKGTIMIEVEFFGTRPLLQTENPVSPKFAVPPMIRFENVSFSYPDTDSLVLKNINLSIESGSKVAIVGKNGSGKSSLISLLLRHYDPTGGQILVGDLYLRTITQSSWSETVSALMQNYTVHDRLVGEEIASSRLDKPIDLEMVNEASRFARFDEIVRSDPKGFDSQIGTEFGGREFSGGEEQRLALARVKYRNTPILILDEPDAKLDSESAQSVIDNIFALKGVTIIIVTQHLSRATMCDKIVLMQNGEIAEQGSHSELMTLGKKYVSLFEKDKKRLNAR